MTSINTHFPVNRFSESREVRYPSAATLHEATHDAATATEAEVFEENHVNQRVSRFAVPFLLLSAALVAAGLGLSAGSLLAASTMIQVLSTATLLGAVTYSFSGLIALATKVSSLVTRAGLGAAAIGAITGACSLIMGALKGGNKLRTMLMVAGIAATAFAGAFALGLYGTTTYCVASGVSAALSTAAAPVFSQITAVQAPYLIAAAVTAVAGVILTCGAAAIQSKEARNDVS